MSKRAVMVAVWMLGTVSSTALAWSAVSVVGGQVTDDRTGRLSVAEVAEAAVVTTVAPTGVVPTGSARTGAPPLVAPTMALGSAVTTTSVRPGAPEPPPPTVASPTGSSAPTTHGPQVTVATTAVPVTGQPPESGSVNPPQEQPGATVSPGPTAPPPTVEAGPIQTFDAVGGSVGVRCRGDASSLEFATPRGGYTTVVRDVGPDKVDVEFDNGPKGSRLVLRCSGGSAISQIREN